MSHDAEQFVLGLIQLEQFLVELGLLDGRRHLARDLEKRRYRASALQGNMSQNARQRAITGFRDGKYDILVATDIAARGIDVSEITHVINFDMPDTVDAYTHRIGRTGRAHLSGQAYTFADQSDAEIVRDIEKVLGEQIERRRLPGFDYGGFTPESQLHYNPQQRAKSRPKNGTARPRSGRNGGGQQRQRRRKQYASKA